MYVKERKISLGRRKEGRERGNREKGKGVGKRRREMRWEKMEKEGGEIRENEGKWGKRDEKGT